MKKNFTLALVLLLAVVAGAAKAQDKSYKKVRIGLGVEGAIPTSAGYDYGAGATFRVAIALDENSAITGTTGVMAFIPKSITGVNTKAQT
jgi:hypothetical protein